MSLILTNIQARAVHALLCTESPFFNTRFADGAEVRCARNGMVVQRGDQCEQYTSFEDFINAYTFLL